MVAGIECNLHRGKDAAGFWVSYPKAHAWKKEQTARLVWMKQPGDGQELANEIALGQDDIDYGQPVSMAIHTTGTRLGW